MTISKKRILDVLTNIKPQSRGNMKRLLKFLCSDKVSNMSPQRLEVLVETWEEISWEQAIESCDLQQINQMQKACWDVEGELV